MLIYTSSIKINKVNGKDTGSPPTPSIPTPLMDKTMTRFSDRNLPSPSFTSDNSTTHQARCKFRVAGGGGDPGLPLPTLPKVN